MLRKLTSKKKSLKLRCTQLTTQINVRYGHTQRMNQKRINREEFKDFATGPRDDHETDHRVNVR